MLKRDVCYNVYIPSNEIPEESTQNVLYLLHGHGGDHMDWFELEEGNVAFILDSLINNRLIPPLIAVSANAGNSWYVNSVENMQSFYLNEFVPHIESSLGGEGYSLRRYIAGNSAGGYGALQYALKQPGNFEKVILLSPAAYDPLPPAISSSRKVEAFAMNGEFNDSIWESYSYKKLLDGFNLSKVKPKFHLSVGDDDPYNIVPVVAALQQMFLEINVQNELRITDGGHDWECWRMNFSQALIDIFQNSNF
jgi:enterochelin esterase-like enzyme